jgi:hypothetical protein
MMKIPRFDLFLLLVVSLTFVVLVPCHAMAQETNPPPCCDKASPPNPNTAIGGGTQSQVIVPDSMLLTMGIRRSDFLDRLVAGLFPDEQIWLIYSVTTSVSVLSDASVTGKSPELVTVTYQYRVPKSQMQSEEIDALDRFIITNGVTCIEINFVRAQFTTPLQ